MMILITGRSGSGKTTILRKLNYHQTFFMDDVVKQQFYLKGHPVYEKIVKTFGSSVCDNNKIITTNLGKIVFNSKWKFYKLNLIVFPYIKKFLNELKDKKELILVEMAIYINHEKKFKKFFDRVVLITKKNENIENKFNYWKEKKNPIKNKNIKTDLVINNFDLDEALEHLSKFINSFNKNNDYHQSL